MMWSLALKPTWNNTPAPTPLPRVVQEESPSQVRQALDEDTYYRVDASGAEAEATVWNALPPERGLTEKELQEKAGLSRSGWGARLSARIVWCREGESNPHGLAPTRF